MFEILVALPVLVKAAILGVVEGLTEFLPISSTGHLILAGSLLGHDDASAKVFDIAIQTGAIFAVIVYFRRRILSVLGGITTERSAQQFALNVVIGFLPAAMIGVLFASKIKQYLFAPVPVAIALVVGGLVIMAIEYPRRKRPEVARIDNVDDMTWVDALKVGFAQVFALIPGTSRSGATIIGGMLFGLSRKVATEYSFYLAIPTLIGAGVYELVKYRDLLSTDDIPVFAVGTIVAFFSAWACVAWLIRYVASRDFVPFAWYRIVFGLIVLATAWTGAVNWSSG